MGIKWKNMTKKGKAGLLLWCVLVLIWAVYIWLCYSEAVVMFMYITGGSGRGIFLLAAGMILLSLAAVYVYFLFFPSREWKETKAGGLDGILTELLAACALVLGAAGLGVILNTSFWDRGIFYFDYDFSADREILALQSGARGLITFLVILALTVLGGLICVLLIRKKLLGNWKETSFIWKILCAWRDSAPLEKRVRAEERAAFLISILCAAVSVAASLWSMVYWNVSGSALVTLAVPIIMAAVMLKLRKTDLVKDTAALLNQIEKMSDGHLDAEPPRIQDPDILQGSWELCRISENLQKTMDRQVKAERMRVDLITNVSHDLKTPLTSMIGYLDLLKKSDLSGEARDYVEILSAKHEQLTDMIQDIFELSKSTSGTSELHMEELDMKKLLEQTLGDMEDAITKSGMDIREKLPGTPLLFMGDGKKMYRVLQNLISNALKYSMKGTRIYIEASRQDGTVRLEVKNTASYEMDFSADEILERFVRADKARNTEEGHGLGLAIADSFVKNMGGRLNAAVDGDQFKVKVEFPEI